MSLRQLRFSDKSRPATTGFLLRMGLLLVVLGVSLVACGTNTGGGGVTNPTPTVSTQVQKCGSVQTNPMGHPLDGASAKQAENCFWQADQKCQPATLTYTATSVDTIATHTFTIANNGGQCSVTDTVKHSIVPAQPKAAKTYTCGSVAQKPDGLHFSSCGEEGEVVVPTITGS